MNKYVLSLLFLLLTATVFGQSKSKVNLVSSTRTEGAIAPDGSRIFKVYKGVFKHDYSTLTSDSAYFYPNQNVVDAFSHVVINQGDTVHIYSDKLNYNGNTKIAILTDHVIMVDKDATLTTNYFTYNTATRIGTYTDGGKLVNKENTVVSKNGYYFAFTRDAYFRYDVVTTTPDAVIKTDTMRYNAANRINYFYGPSIITGKDKDNLYTENGFYNTVTQQAFFGKRNLYTQKTKTLRGDSLFYDRKKGYGKAVGHVTFTDTEQKAIIKGELGEFFKAEEEAVITGNPYTVFVTEDSSAVKKAPKDSLAKVKPKGGADTLLNSKNLAGADSLLKNAKLPGKDSLTKQLGSISKMLPADKKPMADAAKDILTKNLPAGKKLTMDGVKDSITKNLPAVKKAAAANSDAIKNAVAAVKGATGIAAPPVVTEFQKKVIPQFESTYRFADTLQKAEKPKPGIKYDSLYLVADTLRTRVITFKQLKELKQKQYDAAHPDTSIKKVVKKKETVLIKTQPKYIEHSPIPLFPKDTSYMHSNFFGPPKPKAQPKPAPVVAKKAQPVKKLSPQDSLKAQLKADSLALLKPKGLSDTARIRIVSGYHNAKLFKSDLQAKADSMFYATSDSTIRMYVKPMIWTQASQLSGDTINLQMKNKKLDNLDMFPAAFIVNLEKNDSTFYNQAGGKRMHGTFKNGKLSAFAIFGNAETIYFKRDTVKNIVTDMSRTVSGKAYFNFDNGEIVSNSFVQKYEAHATPLAKVKEEEKILKGFIWKPKDRPISKEAILNRPKPSAKKPAVKPAAGTAKAGDKPGIKPVAKPAVKIAGKDSIGTDEPEIKMGKDSISLKPAIKMGKDTLLNQPKIKTGKDTLLNKANVKPLQDTVKKDTTQQRRSVILK